MIKSGFRQLHFLNGNIGKWYSSPKSLKKLYCLKIIKWFSLSFFPRIQSLYTPSCKKTRKKKRGNGSLFLCFIYRQEVYIENEKMLKKL